MSVIKARKLREKNNYCEQFPYLNLSLRAFASRSLFNTDIFFFFLQTKIIYGENEYDYYDSQISVTRMLDYYELKKN